MSTTTTKWVLIALEVVVVIIALVWLTLPPRSNRLLTTRLYY